MSRSIGVFNGNHNVNRQARELAAYQPSDAQIAFRKRIDSTINLYKVTFGSAAAMELVGAIKGITDMLEEMERQIEIFYSPECFCTPDVTDTANVCPACQKRAADTEVPYYNENEGKAQLTRQDYKTITGKGYA